MLSEEEKKAIKVLEQYKKECIEEYKIEIDNVEENIDQQHASYLHQQIESTYRVLNLITKLQKENEELSEKNIENICKGAEEEVLQEYRDKITRLQKENTQEKESWEKYCNELNEEIIEKNNKIFDLEMQVEKLQKEKKEKDKQIIALNQLIDEEM